MDFTAPYSLLLIVSLGFLIQQGLSQHKQNTHYLFALFCFSLCMMCIQKLSADAIGAYHYLIGLATCATCNVMWLLSRALFRNQYAIQKRHIAVAMLIALMILLNQMWHFVFELTLSHQKVAVFVSQQTMTSFKTLLSESTNLLSSCILILSFWEAWRGFSDKTKQQKIQSYLFGGAYFVAVFNSSILFKSILDESVYQTLTPWIVSSSAILIMCAVQAILHMQRQDLAECTQQKDLKDIAQAKTLQQFANIDLNIAKGIEQLVLNKQIFLQDKVKIKDFAKQLDVPEYKISQTIRHYFKSPNFNQFINTYRIEYAKNLLQSNDSQSWSMLVVGMESGFTCALSFNRAFKAQTGELPKQYKEKLKPIVG